MKLQSLNSAKMAISATQRSFNPSELPYSSQAILKLKLRGEEFAAELLDRRWTLPRPDSKIEQIVLKPRKAIHGGESSSHDHFSTSNNKFPRFGPETAIESGRESSFFIVRDDLLHPLVNGNKSRKLDALLPLLEDHSVTDVVTCGGCQSAHTAAIAVSCAERGIKSHLILRGEQPDIPTGYNLVSMMYGNVSYAPRSVYANRAKMLKSYADSVAGDTGEVLWFDDILEESRSRNRLGSIGTENRSRKVVIVNEGAGDVVALLGVIRLVQYLSEDHLFGKHKRLKLIVDTGTGTTAVGLGLGALCLGLPWDIIAVMLTDTVDGYRQHEKRLISDFKRHFGFPSVNDQSSDIGDGIVNWVERRRPRKFGNILEGEIEACQEIARGTGVLVDPVYTLSAWETAARLAENDTNVVMLHTGGTLGMFGLAQRYKSYFSNLKT